MSHINLEKRLVETFFSTINAYIKDYHENFAEFEIFIHSGCSVCVEFTELEIALSIIEDIEASHWHRARIVMREHNQRL